MIKRTIKGTARLGKAMVKPLKRLRDRMEYRPPEKERAERYANLIWKIKRQVGFSNTVEARRRAKTFAKRLPKNERLLFWDLFDLSWKPLAKHEVVAKGYSLMKKREKKARKAKESKKRRKS